MKMHGNIKQDKLPESVSWSHTLFVFYNNTFYKNINAEICVILRAI